MSGWRKRQIERKQNMFTADDPNYGKVYYTIDPRADLSFNYRLVKDRSEEHTSELQSH